MEILKLYNPPLFIISRSSFDNQEAWLFMKQQKNKNNKIKKLQRKRNYFPKKDRLNQALRQSRHMHSSAYIIPTCKSQQKQE